MGRLSQTLKAFLRNAKKGAETRRTQGDREVFGAPYGKKMRGDQTTAPANQQPYGRGPYGKSTTN